MMPCFYLRYYTCIQYNIQISSKLPGQGRTAEELTEIKKRTEAFYECGSVAKDVAQLQALMDIIRESSAQVEEELLYANEEARRLQNELEEAKEKQQVKY